MFFRLTWRFVSRIICLIEIVYAILGGVLISYFALFVFVLTSARNEWNEQDEADSDWELTSWIDRNLLLAWIMLGLAYFCVAMDLCLGIILFKATREGSNPIAAKVKARIWQFLVVALILLNIFLAIGLAVTRTYPLDGWFVLNLVVLVGRSFFFFVVHKFTGELSNKMELGRSSGNGFNST